MGIQAVHTYLAEEILKGLSITKPHAASIKRAYRFIPPARQTLNDVPCAFSTFETPPVEFHSALRIRPYVIHIQIVVGPTLPEGDVAADMAAAFYEALLAKLSANITLGGTVNHINTLRGQSLDTLASLEWGGKAYVGLDLFLDVTISESVELKP